MAGARADGDGVSGRWWLERAGGGEEGRSARSAAGEPPRPARAQGIPTMRMKVAAS